MFSRSLLTAGTAIASTLLIAAWTLAGPSLRPNLTRSTPQNWQSAPTCPEAESKLRNATRAVAEQVCIDGASTLCDYALVVDALHDDGVRCVADGRMVFSCSDDPGNGGPFDPLGPDPF